MCYFFFLFFSFQISIHFLFNFISFKFLGVPQGRPVEFFFLNLNFCSYLSFSIIID